MPPQHSSHDSVPELQNGSQASDRTTRAGPQVSMTPQHLSHDYGQVQGVTGHSWHIPLTANKTVADIKDIIGLSVNPPLHSDQLAIICVAKPISRAKQIIIPDTMETKTIDFSKNRLFVVLVSSSLMTAQVA